MLVLLLILRVIHILGGVFWAGSSFLMTAFVEPTVRGAGDDGRRFMGRFAAQSGFTTAMLIAASATVAAGLWLWWIVSDGLSRAWLETGRGAGLTIGIVAASIAYVVGYVMQNRSIRRLVAIGGRVAASGGPPSPEQAAEMTRLTDTVRKGGRIVMVLLLIAVTLMATARYLPSF
jgi:hypothetical protein